MCRLEEFTKSDITTLLTWLENTDNKFLYQFGGPRYSYPLDEKQLTDNFDMKDYQLLKFVDGDKVIGHCQFMRINPEKSNASIGRLLINPDFRNMGYGQKMIKEMISYAKDELKLSKLLLRVFDFNIGAIKCYERVGFRKCGTESNFIESFSEEWQTISMELDLF